MTTPLSHFLTLGSVTCWVCTQQLYCNRVVLSIHRGLLDDDGFQRSLDDVAKEPVPYFRQLCESPYPSSRPASAETNGSRRSRSPSDLEPTDDDLEFEPELDFGHQVGAVREEGGGGREGGREGEGRGWEGGAGMRLGWKVTRSIFGWECAALSWKPSPLFIKNIRFSIPCFRPKPKMYTIVQTMWDMVVSATLNKNYN